MLLHLPALARERLPARAHDDPASLGVTEVLLQEREPARKLHYPRLPLVDGYAEPTALRPNLAQSAPKRLLFHGYGVGVVHVPAGRLYVREPFEEMVYGARYGHGENLVRLGAEAEADIAGGVNLEVDEIAHARVIDVLGHESLGGVVAYAPEVVREVDEEDVALRPVPPLVLRELPLQPDEGVVRPPALHVRGASRREGRPHRRR